MKILKNISFVFLFRSISILLIFQFGIGFPLLEVVPFQNQKLAPKSVMSPFVKPVHLVLETSRTSEMAEKFIKEPDRLKDPLNKENGLVKAGSSHLFFFWFISLFIPFVFSACSNLPPRQIDRYPRIIDPQPFLFERIRKENQTPELLRQKLLESLNRIIAHLERGSWLSQFHEREELLNILKRFAADPKIEFINQSNWLMAMDSDSGKLYVHEKDVWDMSYVHREGALLHELARQLPSQRKRYLFFKETLRELLEADQEVAEEGDRGNQLRRKFKRTWALWVKNEDQLTRLEIEYYRIYGHYSGFIFMSYLGRLAEGSRNERVRDTMRMNSGVVKPNGKINGLRLRTDLARSFPFFIRGDRRPAIYEIAAFDKVDINDEAAIYQWMDSILNDPHLFDVLPGEKPPVQKSLDEEEGFEPPDDRVRSPAQGWSFKPLNYLFYPLSWIEEWVHYRAAKYWATAHKPIIGLEEAYVEVPILRGSAANAKSFKIALSAPLFWFLTFVSGSVGVYWSVYSLFVAVPAFAMVVLHLYYKNQPGSDLYRALYFLQRKFNWKEKFEFPPGELMRPAQSWHVKAKELTQIKELLRKIIRQADENLFELYQNLPLIHPPVEKELVKEPRKFFQLVMRLGIEADLKTLLLATKVDFVPEDLKDDFNVLKSKIHTQSKKRQDWYFMLADLDDLDFVNESGVISDYLTAIGISRKKQKSLKWLQFLILAKNLDPEIWDQIQVNLVGGIGRKNEFLIKYTYLKIKAEHWSYFVNQLKGLYRVAPTEIKTRRYKRVAEVIPEPVQAFAVSI